MVIKMKYIKQLAVILAVSFLGELLRLVLPFPIPASIYGLILMLIFLVTGIVRLDRVKEAADFLIEIMPLMFIAPAVGLTESLEQAANVVLPLAANVIITTAAVMAVSGIITQLIIKRRERKENK